MREKMFKVAVVFMAVLLLSLTACQSAAPATTSSTAAVTTVATTAAPTEAPPPVTLKYWVVPGGAGTSGIHDDPIMKELTKKTGVIVDLVFNQTQEQFNAQIASGDLPDLMTIVIGNDSKVLTEGGNLIDMEPLLADHGKDIEKGKILFGKDFLSNGQNKLYVLPVQGYDLDAKPGKSFDIGTGIGAYVRWDVYKKIGYPEWNGGLNDLIPILKKMQDAEPTTADGKKVYALSPWLADWGLWNILIYPEGFGNTECEQPGFVDINPATNEMKSQIVNTDSTIWKGARFLNKAWQAGILDPDSFMQKFDQSMSKEAAGRVLMGPCSWAVSGATGAFAKNGETEKGFIEMKTPSNITQVCNMYKNPYTSRYGMSITNKCKYPEKAMDLINFLNSEDGMRLLRNGIEGVNWNVGNDGIPRLTADTIKVFQGPAEDQTAAGFNIYSLLWGYGTGWDSKYNCSDFFMANEDPTKQMATATPFEKDYCQHYSVAYPDQLFEKILPDQGKIYDGSFLQMIDPTPDDIKQINDNIMNYLLVQMVKIIASKTDADFDAAQTKIIAECKNLQCEKAYNWYISQYATALGKVKSFNDSLK